MPFPTYRPLTKNDHKPALLTMALGAAWFTTIAALAASPPKNKPADDATWTAILWSFLPFFGGFFWLVLDSWYHGRAWWKLLFWSSGGSGAGAAQLLGFTGWVPLVVGMWTWVFAMGVVVFGEGFLEEGGGVDEVGDWEAPPLSEHGDDSLQKPIGYELSQVDGDVEDSRPGTHISRQ